MRAMILALVLLCPASVPATVVAAAALPAEMAPNPGFEDPGERGMPAGWTGFVAWGDGNVRAGDEVVHSGRGAVRVEGVRPVTQVFARTSPYEVAPGERFAASCWVRTRGVRGEVGAVLMADFVGVDGRTDSVERFAVVPKEAEQGWVRVEGQVTVPAGAARMRLRVGLWNASGVAWFDDVELRGLTPLGCRIDLPTARLTPGMGPVPVTLVNRAGSKERVAVALTLGPEATRLEVELTGDPVQRVRVPVNVVARGALPMECAVRVLGRADVVVRDRREVTVPAAVVVSPPIPTHWAIEDGNPVIEGEVDLAVAGADLRGGRIRVELRDEDGGVRATWASDDALRDGLNPFRLTCPPLPLGQYTVRARFTPAGGDPAAVVDRRFEVIRREQSRTTLRADGYLVHHGKVVFPLGIFNGAGRSAEMGRAGFTVQHAYNACNAEVGERPDDDAALRFLDDAGRNGLACLFLVPRGLVFGGDWDGFRRRVRMFRNHPALLAWDEEEGLARGDLGPEGLRRMCQILREEDPHHPVMIGDARDEIGRIDDRADLFPAAQMDLGMWWWYPIPPRPASEGSLLNGDDLTDGRELTPPAFLTRARTHKPLWVGLQSYRKPQPWGRYPTPAEYRAQAYIALVHGARGLMWYGGYVEGGVFTRPSTETNWDALSKLVGELRAMESLLTGRGEPVPVVPRGAKVSAATRHADDGAGRTVLLAVNREARPVEVALAVGGPDRVVRVLHEDRDIRVVGGEIRDRFDGYGVHVYELDAGTPPPPRSPIP